MTYGGDLRYRIVDLNEIPLNSTSGGNPDALTLDTTFYRFRTRVWADSRIDPETRLYGRLTNEFRNVWGDDRDDSWDAPDEVVLDSFFIDSKGGRWDIRIGRQDLNYGTGKVVFDGTPLDGSRTRYFNALKASLGLPGNTLDFLGIYNVDEDPLAINSQDRELLGNNVDGETAFGLYWQSESVEALPFEAYSVYKIERQAGADREFTTVGGRLMPKLSPNLSGNLEVAFQNGRHGDIDISGDMIDVAFTYRAGTAMDPALVAGYYRLSGDDPGTAGDDEGWQQVFGRWSQFSELYTYALTVDGGGFAEWSNISVPYVGFDLSPIPDSALKVRLYSLGAVETAAGQADDRGVLATARFDAPLAPRVRAHFLHEWLMPGDYYAGDMDTDAHFSRLELALTF